MATSIGPCIRLLSKNIRAPSSRLLSTSFSKQASLLTLKQSSTSQFRTIHTNPPAMASKQFLESLQSRRTIYDLKKESTISHAQIQEIINQTALHTPSSFNAQSTRFVLLVGEEHNKLWDITREVLTAIVPAEHFAFTDGKLKAFKAAYGTVLFFVNQTTIKGQQEAFAAYADKFPHWGVQTAAMSQYAIWTALELEGLGANLQHYNPIIDDKVRAQWNIPEDWSLDAQLVFGTPGSPAGEKTFLPLEERVKTYGA